MASAKKRYRQMQSEEWRTANPEKAARRDQQFTRMQSRNPERASRVGDWYAQKLASQPNALQRDRWANRPAYAGNVDRQYAGGKMTAEDPRYWRGTGVQVGPGGGPGRPVRPGMQQGTGTGMMGRAYGAGPMQGRPVFSGGSSPMQVSQAQGHQRFRNQQEEIARRKRLEYEMLMRRRMANGQGVGRAGGNGMGGGGFGGGGTGIGGASDGAGTGADGLGIA